MAQVALMAASIAFSAMQTSAQNKSLRRRQEAANETARRSIEELSRQQGRADEVAQEQKSDRAREMDIALGTIIAAGADGGQTAAGIARMGGAAAAVAGLDIGRFESNRQEGQSQRRSKSVSILEENIEQQRSTKEAINNNKMQFFGNAIGTVVGGFASGAFSPVPPVPTPSSPAGAFGSLSSLTSVTSRTHASFAR
jgi:ferritin-like metal-binding protein YciE